MIEQLPEFSRIISVSRIPPKGAEEHLEAKPAERAGLTKRFSLLDLPSLKAEISLIPGSRQTINAKGKIEADIVQQCVVTLDPVESHLSLDVDVVFLPSEDPDKDSAKSTSLEELEGEFEYFSSGKIDIGELVAQQLGVNLDPYPRKPDAALTKTEFGAKAETAHPFAKLSAAVKGKKNKGKA